VSSGIARLGLLGSWGGRESAGAESLPGDLTLTEPTLSVWGHSRCEGRAWEGEPVLLTEKVKAKVTFLGFFFLCFNF
jgi:hypothetical protein